MKIKDYLLYSEPLLLYFVLFFPSIFTNNNTIVTFFTSVSSLGSYIIISIPQILLILYFFYIKKWDFKENSITKHFLKTVLLIIIYTILLLIISNTAALVLIMTGAMQAVSKINSIKQLIPLYLAVSLITGYREELFFRSYLINFFEKTANNQNMLNHDRINKMALVMVISLMFSICHIAQGIGGIIISFLNSLLLCFIFFKHKNIHINALSHALYNFFVLLASIFAS